MVLTAKILVIALEINKMGHVMLREEYVTAYPDGKERIVQNIKINK